MKVSGRLRAPGRFTSRERAPGTHWIRAELAPEPVWTLRRREMVSRDKMQLGIRSLLKKIIDFD
jgi:hypothetical protein